MPVFQVHMQKMFEGKSLLAMAGGCLGQTAAEDTVSAASTRAENADSSKITSSSSAP